jgi:hypothetical protein
MKQLENAIIQINLWLNTLIYMFPDKNLIDYTKNNITYNTNIITDFISYFYLQQFIHEINYSFYDRINKPYANTINLSNILKNMTTENQKIFKNITCNTFYSICNNNDIFEILNIKKIKEHHEFCLYLTKPQYYC